MADVVMRYPVTAALSEALKPVIGMSRLFEEEAAAKESTVGAVASTVTVTGEPYREETLPVASLTQGYSVYEPELETA